MTRRMLLTLIAILTGLSWQGAGVSARALPEAAHISAVSALATVQQAKASAVLARPVAGGFQVAAVVAPEAPKSAVLLPVSGALVPIDRARE